MTILERHRLRHFQAKDAAMQAPEQHAYFGSHNVWYGETVHECNCGFESHEKQEVLEHVEKEAANDQR